MYCAATAASASCNSTTFASTLTRADRSHLRNVCAAIDAKMHPLANGLAGALTSLPLDNSKVGQALVGVDEGTRQIPSMLSGTLDEVDAKAIADAVGLVEKVVAR